MTASSWLQPFRNKKMDSCRWILKLILVLLVAGAVAAENPARQVTKNKKVASNRSGNDPNVRNASPRQDSADPATTESTEHVWGGPVPVPTFPPSHHAPAPAPSYYPDPAPAPAPASYYPDPAPAPAPASYYPDPAPAPAPSYYPEPAPAPAPSYYPEPAPAPAPYYSAPAPVPYYPAPAPAPSYHPDPAPAPSYSYQPAPAPAASYYPAPEHDPEPAPAPESANGYYYYYYPVKDEKGGFGKLKGHLTREEKSWLGVLIPVAIIAVGVPILAVILSGKSVRLASNPQSIPAAHPQRNRSSVGLFFFISVRTGCREEEPERRIRCQRRSR